MFGQRFQKSESFDKLELSRTADGSEVDIEEPSSEDDDIDDDVGNELKDPEVVGMLFIRAWSGIIVDPGEAVVMPNGSVGLRGRSG